MSVVLDAGAFIAVERADRRVAAMFRVAQQHGLRVRTSAAVVAQIWRADPRQARLARILQGVQEVSLDARSSRHVGATLESSGTSDVVDGHVATLVSSGDSLLTSDPGAIAHLLGVLGVDATVVGV